MIWKLFQKSINLFYCYGLMISIMRSMALLLCMIKMIEALLILMLLIFLVFLIMH